MSYRQGLFSIWLFRILLCCQTRLQPSFRKLHRFHSCNERSGQSPPWQVVSTHQTPVECSLVGFLIRMLMKSMMKRSELQQGTRAGKSYGRPVGMVAPRPGKNRWEYFSFSGRFDQLIREWETTWILLLRPHPTDHLHLRLRPPVDLHPHHNQVFDLGVLNIYFAVDLIWVSVFLEMYPAISLGL